MTRNIYTLCGLSFLISTLWTSVLINGSASTIERQILLPKFEWKSLPLGGGGYITGIVIHPHKKDLIYIRTDVGGIYKYIPPKGKKRAGWQQLMNWIPVESPHLWSCDGIAINPQKINEVFAFLGSASYNEKPYGLYKSENQGKTWKLVYETKCQGNENERWIGEPIAVQPQKNGNIVLAGTRFDGLIRSVDGGRSWNKIPSIPYRSNGLGIRSIVFNPQNTQYVYAVDATTVYYSEDAGSSFRKLFEGVGMRQGVISNNGHFYVTTNNGLYGGENGMPLKKYNNLPFDGDLNAIAVNPQNALHLVVSEQGSFNCRLFQTLDGGDHWTEINQQKIKNYVPWYHSNHFAAAVASIKIDPYYYGRLWFTDWYLPWKSDNIYAPNPYFESVPFGIEELVVFDMVSPSNDCLLYQGCADNGGFTHTSLNDYPDIAYDNQESTGIDFCEHYPDFIVRVSSLGWGDNNFKLSVSRDCGKTWKNVGGQIEATGKVAFSAQDTNNFIFAPTQWEAEMKYTIDGGKTPMKKSQGIPKLTVNSSFWDNWNHFIASDRVDGKKFYAALPGQFYVSEDGGAHFNMRSAIPPISGSPAYYLATSPYQEGVLYLSTGASGLFFSSNSGTSFSKLGDFSSSKCVAVGPPIKKGEPPIIYVFGKLEQDWGIYLSYDGGLNWIKMNDEQMEISNFPRQMTADRNQPGRVFIGTGGCGIYYSQPH